MHYGCRVDRLGAQCRLHQLTASPSRQVVPGTNCEHGQCYLKWADGPSPTPWQFHARVINHLDCALQWSLTVWPLVIAIVISSFCDRQSETVNSTVILTDDNVWATSMTAVKSTWSMSWTSVSHLPIPWVEEHFDTDLRSWLAIHDAIRSDHFNQTTWSLRMCGI